MKVTIANLLLILAVICFALGAARVPGPDWLNAGLAFATAGLLLS